MANETGIPVVGVYDPYWKTVEPHEQHGNIYYPYHVMESGWRRYSVVTAKWETVAGPMDWVSATSTARRMNEETSNA